MSELLTRIDQTTIYIQPILFVLIIITNILNILILRSPSIRSSSCAYYFCAYSINSIIYISFVCPVQMLRYFSKPWTSTPFGCKFQTFVVFTLTLEVVIVLVLSSFDRFCSTCKSTRIRSFSNIKTAKRMVFISITSSIIYVSPMLIILYYDYTLNLCLQKLDLVSSIYTLSQLVLYHLLLPSLLTIFGIGTIYNIRKQSNHVVTAIVQTRYRRTESQLTRMLILQIIAHLIFTVPYSMVYSMNALIPSTRTKTILAIRQLTVPWFQCDFFFFFFLYIYSGTIYRQELFRLLRFSQRNRILPSLN